MRLIMLHKMAACQDFLASQLSHETIYILDDSSEIPVGAFLFFVIPACPESAVQFK